MSLVPGPVTRVLLIDDDEDEFVLVRSYLESRDGDAFEVDWVRTFDEGLAALRRGGHDVYLVDHRLGAETGLRLLEKVRDQGLRRPVILFTGAAHGDLDRAALRAGAFDYLDKSDYREADLRRSVRYAAERGRIEGQLQIQAEILAHVHDAVFLVDETGVVRSWNPAAELIFGYPASRAIGMEASAVCPRLGGHLARQPTAERREFSTWCRRASGEKVWVAVRLRFLRAAGGLAGGVIVCANDISEQVRLEQQISEASEAEQRRIGQDIHDDLCQQLASAGCFLKAIEQRIAKNHRDEAKSLESLGSLLAEANARAREISRGLFPAALQVGGLPAALEDLADRTGRTFGIECAAVCALSPAVPESAAVQLYRIAQEAVGNAARHARAKRVDIRLVQEESLLTLTVRDDGEGMAEPEGGPSRGMGLLTMAHRSRLLGADLDIHSAPGKGTEIRVSLALPFVEPEPAAAPTVVAATSAS
jgi:PAS domain S-box-containing protein